MLDTNRKQSSSSGIQIEKLYLLLQQTKEMNNFYNAYNENFQENFIFIQLYYFE